MQGFLNRINKTIEVLWDDYSKKYPGFFYKDQNGQKNMPRIIAAQTMLNLPDFPIYAKRYVDKDPTSWYFMMNASPMAGAADRETAVELFYDIFHNKLHQRSSFEDEGYDAKTAPDMEVLPAALDRNYKTYYEQQMEELAKMMGMMPDEDAEKKAADDEFEKKFGFRRDDPDIIDIDVDEPAAQQKPGIQKVDPNKFAVGALRKIWYAVDLHVPAGMELGYDKNKGMLDNIRNRRNRLGGPGGGVRRLREEDLDAMVQEASAAKKNTTLSNATNKQLLDELKKRFKGKNDKLWADLDYLPTKYNGFDECEKCGDPACKDGEICGLKEGKKLNEAYLTQDDRDEIADMFANYASGPIGTGNSDLDIFMTSHADELLRLSKSRASKLGDFNAARDLDNDDEVYESDELCEGYLSQEDKDDIADMFAGYSGGGSSLGISRSALDRFMTAHAAELKQLRKGQASGFGDFNAARDIGNDDEQYESEQDIENEIAGIVNEGDTSDEEASDTEKLIREYDMVKDDMDETDDDVLSESVIRHANMLSREIW